MIIYVNGTVVDVEVEIYNPFPEVDTESEDVE